MIHAERGHPQPKIENKNFCLKLIIGLGKIQYFKPMLFLFVFSLVENQTMTLPPRLEENSTIFFNPSLGLFISILSQPIKFIQWWN